MQACKAPRKNDSSWKSNKEDFQLSASACAWCAAPTAAPVGEAAIHQGAVKPGNAKHQGTMKSGNAKHQGTMKPETAKYQGALQPG
eukprot:1068905-Pelagomonas_calceolata.AAC.5